MPDGVGADGDGRQQAEKTVKEFDQIPNKARRRVALEEENSFGHL